MDGSRHWRRRRHLSLIAAHPASTCHDFRACSTPLPICSDARVLRTSTQGQKKDVPVDELGPATAKWDYLDAWQGHLIAVVYRYDPPGQKKQFRPWDAKRRKMAPPDPRPLYNQPGMTSTAQVVLVEGENARRP